MHAWPSSAGVQLAFRCAHTFVACEAQGYRQDQDRTEPIVSLGNSAACHSFIVPSIQLSSRAQQFDSQCFTAAASVSRSHGREPFRPFGAKMQLRSQLIELTAAAAVGSQPRSSLPNSVGGSKRPHVASLDPSQKLQLIERECRQQELEVKLLRTREARLQEKLTLLEKVTAEQVLQLEEHREELFELRQLRRKVESEEYQIEKSKPSDDEWRRLREGQLKFEEERARHEAELRARRAQVDEEQEAVRAVVSEIDDRTQQSHALLGAAREEMARAEQAAAAFALQTMELESRRVRELHLTELRAVARDRGRGRREPQRASPSSRATLLAPSRASSTPSKRRDGRIGVLRLGNNDGGGDPGRSGELRGDPGSSKRRFTHLQQARGGLVLFEEGLHQGGGASEWVDGGAGASCARRGGGDDHSSSRGSHLMSDAIRGHQRSSEVIDDHSSADADGDGIVGVRGGGGGGGGVAEGGGSAGLPSSQLFVLLSQQSVDARASEALVRSRPTPSLGWLQRMLSEICVDKVVHDAAAERLGQPVLSLEHFLVRWAPSKFGLSASLQLWSLQHALSCHQECNVEAATFTLLFELPRTKRLERCLAFYLHCRIYISADVQKASAKPPAATSHVKALPPKLERTKIEPVWRRAPDRASSASAVGGLAHSLGGLTNSGSSPLRTSQLRYIPQIASSQIASSAYPGGAGAGAAVAAASAAAYAAAEAGSTLTSTPSRQPERRLPGRFLPLRTAWTAAQHLFAPAAEYIRLALLRELQAGARAATAPQGPSGAPPPPLRSSSAADSLQVDVDFFLLSCLVFFDLSTQPQPASKAATRLEHPMAGALLATLRHSLVLERDVHAAVAQARARADGLAAADEDELA